MLLESMFIYMYIYNLGMRIQVVELATDVTVEYICTPHEKYSYSSTHLEDPETHRRQTQAGP
jgi:hypothetical protein